MPGTIVDKLIIPKELSISRFNLRVLEEALSKKHTAIEKLSYLSIYESNTKEFFEVRVGKILNKFLACQGDLSSDSVYSNLFDTLKHQELHNLAVFATAFDLLKGELSRKKIHFIDCDGLKKSEQKAVLKELQKVPYSPKTVGHADQVDVSQERYISLSETTTDGEYVWCELPHFSNFIFRREDGLYVLPYEKAIIKYINVLFGTDKIKETAILRIYHNHHFKIPKKVQTSFDYPTKLSSLLSKRRYKEVTKIDYCGVLTKNTSTFILEKTNMLLPFIFERRFFDYGFISPIVKFLKEVTPTPAQKYPPIENPYISAKGISETLKKRDILISFPYESTELFWDFCKGLYDDSVESICATLYRVNSNSRLIDSLVFASEKGIKVRVYIELLARGSEDNNIQLAEYLMLKGIEVKTNMEGFKVHSKLICVKKKNPNGEFSYQTLVGTGNFNESTMRLYTDFHLITASPAIYQEAESFFGFLFDGIQPTFSKLLVTNFNFKDRFIHEIDKEIEFAKSGGKTQIILKANGLNHPDVILKLMEASRYMPVKLYIRGVCAVVPGIEEYTPNMEIYSIVGKFLEHSRIYSFGIGKRNRIFIGSCDIMTRNIDKRYEVCVKVESAQLKAHLSKFLFYASKDTVNKHILGSNKQYIKASTPPISDSFRNQYAYLKNIKQSKQSKQSKALQLKIKN
ncbi:MAG: phospholipase D-like domain-containing protein [Bacillota bacterium]